MNASQVGLIAVCVIVLVAIFRQLWLRSELRRVNTAIIEFRRGRIREFQEQIAQMQKRSIRSEETYEQARKKYSERYPSNNDDSDGGPSAS